MSRTRGSMDKSKRKRRSDYKGKRHYISFPKIKGNKTEIKLWVWKVEPMSYDGYMRFKPKARLKIKKEVKIPLKDAVIIVPVNEIDTEEKFVNFFLNLLLRTGDFLIMGFSHAGNKYRTKPVKVARILIRENEDGLYGKMTLNYRLWRYWFYKK